MDALKIRLNVHQKTALIPATVRITVVGTNVLSMSHQKTAGVIIREFGNGMIEKDTGMSTMKVVSYILLVSDNYNVNQN